MHLGRTFLVLIFFALVKLRSSNSSILKHQIKASRHYLDFGPTLQESVRFSSSVLRTINQADLCILHVYFGPIKVCIPRPHLDSKVCLAMDFIK